MTDANQRTWLRVTRVDVIHSLRTAIAALLSLEIGRLLKLPESYWSAITTLIVMQSTWGASLAASSQRFAGTVLGCAMGGLLSTYFPSSVPVFMVGVFVQGLICAALRIDKIAFRFSSVTLVIVMLIDRAGSPRVIALHRFIEVSVGLAVGLLLTVVWPEPETTAQESR